MLKISGVVAKVVGKIVLDGVDLEIGRGKVVVLIGANGSGKSSLANVVMGNPEYQVVGRSAIKYGGKDLLKMSVDERSRAGILVVWQSPVAVPGVSMLAYLRAIYEASGQKIESMVGFRTKVEELLSKVGLNKDLVKRSLNEGFSGGEKKRFEILQVLLLRPKLAILDEIDSGLDVDGLKMISEIVKEMKDTAFLIITHYKKLLDYVHVDKVVVLANGRVVVSGGYELVEEIEKNGYGKYK